MMPDRVPHNLHSFLGSLSVLKKLLDEGQVRAGDIANRPLEQSQF